MTLDESKTGDDVLDTGYGVPILTDIKLATYLEGATIDYIESKNGGGFEIRTAKTTDGGGCDSCGGSCS